MNLSSTIPLNNGIEIPLLGLGVFQNPSGASTRDAVAHALRSGYRHIDTAMIYRNERDVGEGIRASGVERNEIFVTTKLWNSDQGYDSAHRALDASLNRLGLDHIDLYLLHWPVPGERLESWRALGEAMQNGRTRSIGVSNFLVPHLMELLDHSEIIPAVNQIELSPYNYQQRIETIEFCREHGIAIEAYSPLTKAIKLADPRLVKIAGRLDKTPAQVLIRWGLEHGFIELPKSANPSRIEQNAAVFDFEIGEEDMVAMDSWNENLATGWDPTGAP